MSPTPICRGTSRISWCSSRASLGRLKLDQEFWLEASKFKCKHADAEIFVAYSQSLEKRNPKAAKFPSQIQLDPAVVNQCILKIGRDKEVPQDVAAAWVKANKATVDKWIN